MLYGITQKDENKLKNMLWNEYKIKKSKFDYIQDKSKEEITEKNVKDCKIKYIYKYSKIYKKLEKAYKERCRKLTEEERK